MNYIHFQPEIVKRLIKDRISINQYFLLYCIEHVKMSMLTEYEKVFPFDEIIDIQNLWRRGYITVEKVPNETLIPSNKYVITEKGTKLILETTDLCEVTPISRIDKKTKEFTPGYIHQQWNLFYSKYPQKVHRKDGSLDYLRTDSVRTKNIFNKLALKENIDPKDIVLCLKLEIDQREREGSMQYFKRMPKWFSERCWEPYYLQIQEGVTSEKAKPGYGGKIN